MPRVAVGCHGSGSTDHTLQLARAWGDKTGVRVDVLQGQV
jgi:hypothetical protein